MSYPLKGTNNAPPKPQLDFRSNFEAKEGRKREGREVERKKGYSLDT